MILRCFYRNSFCVMSVTLLAPAMLLAQDLLPRTPFSIPLAKLSIGDSDEDGEPDRVKISYPDSKDQWIISRGDDSYVSSTRYGKETHLFTEPASDAQLLNDIEAEQLDCVTRTLTRTLDIFVSDLQGKRWDRCLYLDAYLPRFLNGFYHLYCAARNSPRALPRVADIPDRAYEVSLYSAVSDQRVMAWKEDPEYAVRLRVITRELIYQARRWQKAELVNRQRNPDARYAKKFELAYGMFVRMYFNLTPSPRSLGKGEHL